MEINLMNWILKQFPALQNMRFAVFLAGYAASAVGNSFNILALNLLLFAKTQDVTALTTMWIVRTLARLLFQPYLGVIVDRVDRRKLLLVTQLLNALTAFSFVFVNTDTLLLVYVLTFALQILDGLLGPAVGSVVPQIVEKESLISANTVVSLASKIAATLGSTLGALLYARYSADVLFMLNATSFLISFFTILPLRMSVPRVTRKPQHWFADFKAGAGIIVQYPIVMLVFGIIFVNSLIWRSFEVLIVPLMSQQSSQGTDLGFLYSSLTIGGFLGAFIAPQLNAWKRYTTSILIGSFAFTIIPFIIFGSTSSLSLQLAGMVLSGILLDIIGIYSSTLVQQHVPNEFLGRVFAFQNVTIALGGLPALLSLNPLTQVWGYQSPFLLISGIIFSVTLVFILLFFKPVVKKNKEAKP
jgi:MFS family permease